MVWDEDTKRTAHGPLREDVSVLHVAVARLLGYRWPAERGRGDGTGSRAARLGQPLRGVARLRGRGRHRLPAGGARRDGGGSTPVCGCCPRPTARRGATRRSRACSPPPAAEASTTGCATASLSNTASSFTTARSSGISGTAAATAFTALINYHKLATPGDGDGRRLLESVTYSYLGDWITRQKDGIERGVAGAEDRLAAALRLQQRLDAITVGERPFDIFVRWKPLAEQPNRLGAGRQRRRAPQRPPVHGPRTSPAARPAAGILRAKPNVHWRKDRGKEPRTLPAGGKAPPRHQDEPNPHDDRDLRPPHDYPWFWPNGQFTGDRVNDQHLTVAEKQIARSRYTPVPER